jgi:hypothetical protein
MIGACIAFIVRMTRSKGTDYRYELHSKIDRLNKVTIIHAIDAIGVMVWNDIGLMLVSYALQ